MTVSRRRGLHRRHRATQTGHVSAIGIRAACAEAAPKTVAPTASEVTINALSNVLLVFMESPVSEGSHSTRTSVTAGSGVGVEAVWNARRRRFRHPEVPGRHYRHRNDCAAGRLTSDRPAI
jgi:hypothetical protein